MKASEDLKKESSELRKLNNMMLRALENAGFAEFKRDDEGNAIGIFINAKASAEAFSTTGAEATVTKDPDRG